MKYYFTVFGVCNGSLYIKAVFSLNVSTGNCNCVIRFIFHNSFFEMLYNRLLFKFNV
nr:MAG TPA: hypothetical protein [Caudoviricetes sp.]